MAVIICFAVQINSFKKLFRLFMFIYEFCDDFRLVIFVCAILDLTYPQREQDQQIQHLNLSKHTDYLVIKIQLCAKQTDPM